MKYKQSINGLGVTAMLAALALTGCGSSGPPIPRDDIPVQKFEITGDDKMKFNITELSAKPRQRVELTLTNKGSMPKQSMGHNWILLAKGTDAKAFVEAGLTSASTEYIAPGRKREVLAHTSILGPKESETISFTAPQDPGSYDYICGFPGHLAAGMAGVLKIAE